MTDEELDAIWTRHYEGTDEPRQDLSLLRAIDREATERERERCRELCDAAHEATKARVPASGHGSALAAGVHDGRLAMAEEISTAIRGGK